MPENVSLPPEAVVTQMIFGKWVSMALSVAAKLRLADALADGPKSMAELAASTGTHAPSLFRVLRALASVGVFAEEPDGRFRQTPLSEVLRSNVPGSMRAVADYCGADWSWRPWGQLLETVRTGKTAFDAVFGEQAFDYLAKHPAESEVFNEGMTGFSMQAAPAVAEAYDFSPFGTIVDVGGGHGLLLTTILAKYPGPRGVVFDSPHVVAGAGPRIAEAVSPTAAGRREAISSRPCPRETRTSSNTSSTIGPTTNRRRSCRTAERRRNPWRNSCWWRW